jgi:pilus assembly protein CpaF
LSTRLLDLGLEHDELADLDPAARRLALRDLLLGSVGEELGPAVRAVADAIDGYGVLADLMRDELVTDVLVNGPDEVWIEREGALERTEVRFADRAALDAFVERALGGAGVRVDASCPVATGRLPDGARMHAVLPPVAPSGPLVAIRRWRRRPLRLADLVVTRFLSPEDAASLAGAVRAARTIAISGATGSGKTTLMNALLAEVPASERVVTIEETPELRREGGHAVSLVARAANVEGRGAIDLDELVRAALRMRPDRIVIGEVRGAEALAALAAMSTGHEGSMLTVHARSANDALERIVALALQGSSGASERSLERQARRALDLVVHLCRDPDGSRRIGEVFEFDPGP